MSPEEFRAKWVGDARTMDQRGALVNGAALLHEMLNDFDTVVRCHDDEPLTLAESARESGYSADYLGVLIRQGKIPNAGRPGAPRIFRRDLPRRLERDLRSAAHKVNLASTTPGQIARSVVTSKGVTDE